MYSLSLNIARGISFTLEKSRVKNIRCYIQAVLRCKIVGAGFHSIAKFCAQILNPLLADRHNENGCTADCQSQESKFESGLPQD
jgi:hypothetical protein